MTILHKHLIFVPLCFIAFAALFGSLVMLLWNWLMPAIFALPSISFCQAVGLFVLFKILFGGIGFGHHGHHGMCHSSNKLRERWENMTAEEREQVIKSHRGCLNKTETNGK